MPSLFLYMLFLIFHFCVGFCIFNMSGTDSELLHRTPMAWPHHAYLSLQAHSQTGQEEQENFLEEPGRHWWWWCGVGGGGADIWAGGAGMVSPRAGQTRNTGVTGRHLCDNHPPAPLIIIHSCCSSMALLHLVGETGYIVTMPRQRREQANDRQTWPCELGFLNTAGFFFLPSCTALFLLFLHFSFYSFHYCLEAGGRA